MSRLKLSVFYRELFFFLFDAGVWPDLQDKVPGGAFSIVCETITIVPDIS